MPDSTAPATIYLPLSTWVHVRVAVNAAYQQQITISYENGTSTILTGVGEHDTVPSGGDFSLTTPGQAGSPLGYKVTVSVKAMSSGGLWNQVPVAQGLSEVMNYRMAMVVAEDSEDQDWNDSVVMLSWWVPPSARD